MFREEAIAEFNKPGTEAFATNLRKGRFGTKQDWAQIGNSKWYCLDHPMSDAEAVLRLGWGAYQNLPEDMTKEEVYEKEILPLVEKIKAICLGHDIPYGMKFCVGEDEHDSGDMDWKPPADAEPVTYGGFEIDWVPPWAAAKEPVRPSEEDMASSGITHCGDCAFWERTDAVHGDCRRSVPAMSFEGDEPEEAQWPCTEVSHGCGEGKKRV